MEVSKTLQAGLAIVEHCSGCGTGASLAHIQDALEIAGLGFSRCKRTVTARRWDDCRASRTKR
eukprot:633500-Prorocentrum_lima.AAC.1